jgi:hypothetical protein
MSPYVQQEERRIEQNLKAVAFDNDDQNTLSLITGPGRIERVCLFICVFLTNFKAHEVSEQYIFPLIFLLLKSHSRIIEVGCQVVLHKNEFNKAIRSFTQVFNAVQERINMLSGEIIALHVSYLSLCVCSSDLSPTEPRGQLSAFALRVWNGTSTLRALFWIVLTYLNSCIFLRILRNTLINPKGIRSSSIGRTRPSLKIFNLAFSDVASSKNSILGVNITNYNRSQSSRLPRNFLLLKERGAVIFSSV